MHRHMNVKYLQYFIYQAIDPVSLTHDDKL